MEHTLLDDPGEDEEENGFRPSRRKATSNENRTLPGVFVMDTPSQLTSEASRHQEILVPVIGLRALKHVQYKTLVRSILEANRDMDITYTDMQLLWDAIVHKVYSFVHACEREAKAMEVFICRL